MFRIVKPNGTTVATAETIILAHKIAKVCEESYRNEYKFKVVNKHDQEV